ncbi:MAG: DUF2934 domain-containing protein [Planctomycetota bacterium]
MSNQKTAAPGGSVQVTDDQIAERAYHIWQSKGCPDGDDGEANWRAAKAELEAECSGGACGSDGAAAPKVGGLIGFFRSLRQRAAM